VDKLELVGSGRDADVFALGEDRVLRRYRDGGDATREAAIMAFVAAHGYPVPTVYDVDGCDLVMELLDGPTMAMALMSGGLELSAGAGLLADLHDRLHALPSRSAAESGDRVIHLDLHPENVMMVSRGAVVIDWRNATDGPPDLDVALSAVILAQVAADDGDERAPVVRELLAGFLSHVSGAPMTRLSEAVARRGADGNATAAERARLGRAEAIVRELA
jgi:tRNA A-37 threonylcarbamoyl transferase component Bud32